MTVLLFLLILTSLYVCVECSKSCGDHFQVTSRCDEPYGTELQAFSTMTLTGCLFQCQKEHECYSATYDGYNNTCKTNVGKTTNMSEGCAFQVTYAEVTKSNCKSNLYSNCTLDSECIAENSICDNGVCKCHVGYSYSPSRNSCVEYCDVYGTTFTRAQGARLLTKNTLMLRNLTLDEAITACISASFVCRSFDYFMHKNKAHLSEANSLNGTIKFNDFNADYYADYYHRNCK